MSNKTILVIAESHAEYKRHFSLGSIRHTYLSSWNSIQGVKLDGIYLHGRWWENNTLKLDGFSYTFSLLAQYCSHNSKIELEDTIIETSL